MTTQVDFGGWIQRAFELLKANALTLILANAIALVLTVITFGVLGGPMMVGVFAITLRLVDGDQPAPSPGDVFDVFRDKTIPSLLVGLALFVLSLVCSLFGRTLGGVITMFATAPLVFAFPLLADGVTSDARTALTRSFEMVKPVYLPMVALMLIAQVLASVGILACGVGIFATLPMYACILAVAYRAMGAQPAG
jgi:uncharacterized membrane protein